MTGKDERGRRTARAAGAEGPDPKMEALARLAGGVAHDMNNMLGAIEGYATLSLRDPAVPEALRADLQEIRKAVGKAAGLTRRLLCFSRGRSAEGELDIQEFLGRLAAESGGPLAGAALEIEPGLPRVRMDAKSLELALSNLVSNARDAMPPGGAVRLAAARAGDTVRISVTDTGCGISPEAMEHLFEPFFTTKEKGRGVGLGLAEVYGIARRYGAAVEINSGRDGTEAALLLAVTAGRAAAPVAAPGAAPAAARAGGPVRVLLVEDDDDLASMTERGMAAEGFRTERARSAAEALARLSAASFDAVFADMVLPDGNFVDAMPKVRALAPGLPVIFTSGYAPDDRVAGYLRESGSVFLLKPYSMDKLAAALRKACGI